MLRQLGFHSDDMALAFILWLCTLPLVALLVVPFFGFKIGGVVALVLFFVAMAICWGVCGWKAFKGGTR